MSIKKGKLMSKSDLRNVATPFVAVTFLVIGITGVLLYFHLFESSVKELHENLGMVFVAVALLHLFVHYKSMSNYFTKKAFIIITALTLIISAVFIYEGASQKGPNPKRVLIESVLQAPLDNSLVVLGIKKEKAIKNLKSENIKTDGAKTIMDISKNNDVSPFRVVSIITKG
jgi:uncharacterized membrane protein